MAAHLVILQRPYLELVLGGRKQVECRLSRIACPPFSRVQPGQSLWLKVSGGPVCGRAVAARVESYQDLVPRRLAALRRRYNHLVLGPDEFWFQRRHSRFATFIWLADVTACEPVSLPKSDRRAWVVLDDGQLPARIDSAADFADRPAPAPWAPAP